MQPHEDYRHRRARIYESVSEDIALSLTRIHLAIHAFGRDDAGSETEDARLDMLIDLLCDLMHWCDLHSVEFRPVLRRSWQHYATEHGIVPDTMAGWERTEAINPY